MRCPKCFKSMPDDNFKCECGYKLNFKNVPPAPKQLGLVNDFEGIITQDFYDKIKRALDEFERNHKIEIVIAVFPNTHPLPPANYAFYLFKNWKLGKHKKQAILILLSMSDRFVKTEIGFGLEKIISEEYSAKMLDHIMVPYFKKTKYGEGIYEGILDLIQELGGRLSDRSKS